MRVSLFIVLLAAASIATAWWARSAAEPEHLTTSHESAAGPIAGDAICRFEPGMSFTHRLHLTVDPKVDSRAMLGPSQQGSASIVTPGVRMSGTLHQRVLRAAPDGGWVLAMAFPDIEIVDASDGQPYPKMEPYRRPFLVRMAKDCTYTAFSFHQDVTPTDAGVLRRTVRLVEFAGPPSPADPDWKTEQVDDIGVYQAAYQRRGARISRARFEYVRVWPPSAFSENPPGLRHTIDASNSVATLATDAPWFARVRMRERSSATLAGKSVSSAAVALDLTAVHVPNVLDGFASEVDGVAWADAHGPPPIARAERVVTPEVAAMSTEEVLAAYASALRTGGRQGFHKALELLIDALTARPELAGQLAQLLEAGKIQKDVRSIVFLALERAGTSQAQAALRDVLRARDVDATDRSRAAVALMDVPEPTEDSVQALIAASRDRRDGGPADAGTNSSTLALGRLEKRLLERGQDGLAGRVRDEIASRLRSSTDPGELAELLGAIGNSGRAGWTEELGSFLDHEDPRLRRAALKAMRAMPPKATADIFAERLAIEGAWDVRATAVEALEQQALSSQEPPLPSVVAAAAALLDAEPDFKARAALIRLLGMAATSSPVARQALALHFPKEKEPSLLVLIGRYVQAFELPVSG